MPHKGSKNARPSVGDIAADRTPNMSTFRKELLQKDACYASA